MPTEYGFWLNLTRELYRESAAHMAGATLARTTAPIPDALADALARFPEEAEDIKADMDTRRAIAALPRHFGVGIR